MIDRIFTAALAFCMLIGATLAIASAWFDSTTTREVAHLPAVEIVATRALPNISVAASDAAEATRHLP